MLKLLILIKHFSVELKTIIFLPFISKITYGFKSFTIARDKALKKLSFTISLSNNAYLLMKLIYRTVYWIEKVKLDYSHFINEFNNRVK